MSLPVMSSSNLAKVFVDVPLVSDLHLFKDGEEFVLIGCLDNYIFSSKIAGDSFTTRTPLASPLQCQEHRLQNEVVTIFQWSEKLYILDSKGTQHQINVSTFNEETLDFFEDPADGASGIAPVFQIDVGTILSACFIQPESVALLSQNHEGDLVFQIFSLNSSQCEQKIVVKKGICPLQNKPILVYVDPLDIKNEFVSSWCPHFNPHELNKGYVFIFNCDESACCIQIGFNELQLGFFFSWPSACMFSFYCKLNSGDNHLLLGFDDGAVVRLSCSGGEIIHVAPFKIQCGFADKDSLLLSDFSDCQFLRLNPNRVSCLLPIKGVICFLPIGNQIIVLTNFGSVYLLESDFQFSEGSSVIPEALSFEETIKNIGYLEQLNSKIAAYNKSIKCFSTAMNAKNFNFDLRVQIVQILAANHLLRVTCKTWSSGSSELPIFNAEQWHVVVTLTSELTKKVQVQRLAQDFTRAQPLMLLIPMKLTGGSSRNFAARVKLVCFVEGRRYCPMVSLGKVNLNAMCFLEPEHSLLVNHPPNCSHESAVAKVLEGQETPQDVTLKTTETAFSVVIRGTLHAGNSLTFEKLLEKSKPLWRTTQWETTCASKKICATIGGKNISIQPEENWQSVTLSGNDLALVVQMKYALLELMGSFTIKGFSEKTLVEAENLLKILEVMEFSRDGPTFSKLFDVYKRKVQFINDPLTWSQFLSNY